MTQFTHTTYASLKSSLAGRLGDTGMVYWTDTELGLYCLEALRTWGLLTGYWRDIGSTATVSGTPLYNVSSITNAGGDALLSSTVTDSNMVSLIQYHLLEPSTGVSWTGSEQFTLADVTGALQRRRDKLLVETGATVTLSSQVLAAGSSTIDLTDTILAIRRLSWKGVSGTDWALYPEDINNQRNYSLSYLLTQGTPQTYSSISTQPLSLQIAPPSNEPGTLSILAVESGAALTAAGIALGIPDDMSWIVKWGALADMLGKQGPAQDLPRSYFCERRWRLGLEAAKVYPTVINAQINGVSLGSDAISSFDQYKPNWYTTTGTPSLIGSLRNYIALSTCPDGIYSILLEVVRKAVLPSADGDFIQIGREILDPLLDYAEHLATFKCGGHEFKHTYRGAQNFFNAALSYNQQLAAKSPNIVEIMRQSTRDDYVLPLKKQPSNDILEQLSTVDTQ